MRVPLTTRDFLDRAELVYGERVGIVDEPYQPAPSLGEVSYRDVARRGRALQAGLDALGVGEGVAVLSWDPADSTVYSRTFANDLSWGEDPATGSAALSTGVWLVAVGLVAPDGTTEYSISQGVQQGRPSVLAGSVTAEGGRATSASVRGAVVPVASGRIRVP